MLIDSFILVCKLLSTNLGSSTFLCKFLFIIFFKLYCTIKVEAHVFYSANDSTKKLKNLTFAILYIYMCISRLNGCDLKYRRINTSNLFE